MLTLSKKIPIIIVVFSGVVAIFGGINQAIGLFKEFNIASVAISVIASIALFFYIPVILSKKPVSEIPGKDLRISPKTIAIIVSLLVLVAGTVPFSIQYAMASHHFNEGEKGNLSGSFAKSQNHWTKAAHLFSRLGFEDKAIGCRICLAQAYAELGKTKDAVVLMNELEKSPGLSLMNQAKLYSVKGTMNVAFGNYIAAEINYQQALQTVEANTNTEATILLNKAVMLQMKGPYYQSEAKELLYKAKDFFLSKKDYQGVANVYFNLASYYESKPTEFVSYLDSAELFAKKDNAVKIEGLVLLNRGYIFKKDGNLEEAEKQYHLARKKFETIADILSQAEVYNKLAHIDIMRSNFASALQKIKDAKAWINQLSADKNNTNHVELAKLYSTQAALLEDCGSIAEAQKMHELALSELNEYRSYSAEINSKINYAAFLQRQAKREEALTVLKEIENLLFSDLKNANNQTVLVAANNLAKLYQDIGQLDKAKQLFENAIKIAINIRNKYFEASTKENLAVLLKLMDLPGSSGYMTEALQFYRQLENKSDELRCLFNMYSFGEASLLPEILNLLNNPSIDYNTKTNTTLSISISAFKGDMNLLRQQLRQLELLIPSLENQKNIMLLGKCHLRIAEAEYLLGNKQECEKHFEPIEKSLSLFPYPQNISILVDFALLNINIEKYQKCVELLIRTFDLANVSVKQQDQALYMISYFWTKLNTGEQEKYRNKLKTMQSNSEDKEFKQMIGKFLDKTR